MALYEFDCRDSGERFEAFRPMSEHEQVKAHPPTCPGCGRADTREQAPLITCKVPVG
jgi:putative FmdB family regulatory protein